MLIPFNAASGHSPDPSLERLLPSVKGLAREAGKILKFHARRDARHGLEYKADFSPVLEADRHSSRVLEQGLSWLTPQYPVVSEENDVMPEGEDYWAVDPLDGTKHFMAGTAGWSVKIALIRGGRPVLGVIYCPREDIMFTGAYKGVSLVTFRDGSIYQLQTRAIPENGKITTLFNKLHADPLGYRIQRQIFKERGLILPVSPKIAPGWPRNMQVAAGFADLHVGSGVIAGHSPGSGYIWDVGPDDIILQNSGGGIGVLVSGESLDYGGPRRIMPGYLAYGDRMVRTKLWPGLEKN